MPDRFLDAMRLLTGAVTVVTAGEGDTAGGLTATAVCSFSATPPRMLVCLNRSGSTFRALVDSGRFCVNVLGTDQQELAMAFAGRTGMAGADKFAGDEWASLPGEAPHLRSALVAVSCHVHLMTVLGSHAVVIGDVVQTHFGSARASLLYREGAFA